MCLWVFMYVRCVCMSIHVCGYIFMDMGTYLHVMHVEGRGWCWAYVFISFYLIYSFVCFWDKVCHWNGSRPIGQQVPEIPLCMLFQLWDYRYALQCLDFYGVWGWLRSWSFHKHFTKVSPQPTKFLFNFP